MLVPLLRRKGVPLAALVSNADSYLAQQADYVLHAPRAPRSLPPRPGPHHQHHGRPGPGRRPGRVPARKPAVHRPPTLPRLHPGGTLGKKLYPESGRPQPPEPAAPRAAWTRR
ncbi:MAG: hypothetical protein WKG07_20010 [Hymenobacter sp.]